MEAPLEEQLAAAGYVGRRGLFLFAALLAVVGAVLGSVFFAIGLNFVLGPEAELDTTSLGAAIGAAVGVGIAVLKVREGNREAMQRVEDASWRRELGPGRRSDA